MSQLKYMLNVLLLSAVVTGLAACDNDGAFKAADLSIKEVPQSKPVLTEEQIKALYELNQKQAQELKQEIALKNEALAQLESKLNSATSELNALSQKMVELLASDKDAGTKSEEMVNLKAQIDALQAQIESDRAQYVEALGKVNRNEETLIAELVKVRQEINKLKEKQGGITDEEILNIEKNLTEQIAGLTAQLEEKRKALETQITELEQKGETLKAEVARLEAAAAAAQTEEEKAKLEAELLAAKEKEVKTQTELNEAVEEYNGTNGNIVTLKCEKPEDCDNVDVTVDGVGNTINVEIAGDTPVETATPVETTDVAQPVETTETLEPVPTTEVAEEVKTTETIVGTDVTESETPPTANPVLSEIEARRAEKIAKKEAEIADADISKKVLLAEIQDLKNQLVALQKQNTDIDNAIFDGIFRKDSVSSDQERVQIEAEIKAKREEKKKVLDEIARVNATIANIQEGDLKQVEDHIKELKRQRIDLMRR
ncbi:MAG: hypothetical protein M9899_07780 [Bdellovibrionaceae bacterium]|nr:hypothetical protein [Pseudobdellovibrionaceae bacterium]